MYLDERLSILPAPLKRRVYSAVWNPDKWNRQALVGGLADGWAEGLDVGGRASEMDAICAKTRFISANVRPPADLLLDSARETLPFADASFDVVTSSDVLEHIPRERRASHIAELARVARHRVVACFPFGTEDHLKAEKRLASSLEEKGIGIPGFLVEHLEYGLPEPDQLEGLFGDIGARSVEFRYQGNYIEGDRMLVAALTMRFRFDPRAARDFLAAARRVRAQSGLSDRPDPATARVFAVVDL